MAKNKFDQIFTGLTKSGWKPLRVGLGKHGLKFVPPAGITTDPAYPEKFVTIQQSVDQEIEKRLAQQIKRFYCIKLGKQIHYSQEQAKQILSGHGVNLN